MRRGCGDRVPGDLYMTVTVGSHGVPIWDSLLDPAVFYPGDKFQGVKISPPEMTQGWPDDTVLLLDMVGQGFYPHVPDFVEEARVIGVSRKIPKSFDFGRLAGKNVMLGLIHWKARHTFTKDVPNTWVYYPCNLSDEKRWPNHWPECIYHLWMLVNERHGNRRVIGDTTYRPLNITVGHGLGDIRLPWGEFQPAVFAVFPIYNFDYIYDQAKTREDNHKVCKAAAKSGLTVRVVES